MNYVYIFSILLLFTACTSEDLKTSTHNRPQEAPENVMTQTMQLPISIINPNQQFSQTYTYQTNPSTKGKAISPYLMGFNNSYFNDLDEVWETANIPDKLKQLNTGLLRFPGGEETSRYNWEVPGANGYVDVWGNHLRQTWQSTAIPPEEFATNTAFMDVDEYFAHCAYIGNEPLLGVTMTIGEVNNRQEDCLNLARRLIQHCKNKNYPLRYVYLDNEPWHEDKSNYYNFPKGRYAELSVKYSKALREINPDLLFVVNPLDGNQLTARKRIKAFLEVAGKHVDVIDGHWYWNWGHSTFDNWKNDLPLKNSSQWKPYKNAVTYTKFIHNVKKLFVELGYEHLQLAVLEWNPGPTQEKLTLEEFTMIQAEMFMQFIEGELDMACVWPMFYQITPPGKEPANGNCGERSIFSHEEPYSTQPSYDMFSLFADAMNSNLIQATWDDTGLYILECRSQNNDQTTLYILNKSQDPHPILFETGYTKNITLSQMGKERPLKHSIVESNGTKIQVSLPQYSITKIETR